MLPCAGLQVDLAVTQIVGEAHFAHTLDRQRVEKPVDALGHEMSVVHRERQTQGRRVEEIEVVRELGQVVGEVVDLGGVGFLVEILEQQPRAFFLGIGGGARETLMARLHAPRLVRAEVKACVHDDPLGAQRAIAASTYPSR